MAYFTHVIHVHIVSIPLQTCGCMQTRYASIKWVKYTKWEHDGFTQITSSWNGSFSKSRTGTVIVSCALKHFPLILSLLFCQASVDPFLRSIRDGLGDQHTPEVGEAYRKGVHWIIKLLIRGFKVDNPESTTEAWRLIKTGTI